MSDMKDDFADVIENTRGVFGSDQPGLGGGLEEFDTVNEGVIPEGAAFEFRCQGCNKPVRITLDFAELVALKFKISPHQAFRGQASQLCPNPSVWAEAPDGSWQLQQRCPKDQWKLRLELDGGDPEKLLRRARRQGYFSPQHEGVVQQHLSRLAQHRRR